MALRMVCCVGVVLVPGPGGIVFLVAALVLPGVAILVANTVDRRIFKPDPIGVGLPSEHKALAIEPTVVVEGECR